MLTMKSFLFSQNHICRKKECAEMFGGLRNFTNFSVHRCLHFYLENEERDVDGEASLEVNEDQAPVLKYSPTPSPALWTVVWQQHLTLETFTFILTWEKSFHTVHFHLTNVSKISDPGSNHNTHITNVSGCFAWTVIAALCTQTSERCFCLIVEGARWNTMLWAAGGTECTPYTEWLRL